MSKFSFSHLIYFLILVFSFSILATNSYAINKCGNGDLDKYEECDDGPNNSDTKPNACRHTGCLLPYCGDGVKDSNEECDDGSHSDYGTENSNIVPGACRTDCRAAYCGDGVLDKDLGEKCDDGADHSSCSESCQPCTAPIDNLAIDSNSYTKLCPGTWHLSDNGSQGVLQVTEPYSMLDCNGAKLVGNEKGSVGIKITGQGVVVRNCELSGFTTGIKIAANGVVLYANRICGNYKDIINQSDSNGQDNECSRITNWQDTGQDGCTISCPPNSYTPPQANTNLKGDVQSTKFIQKKQVHTSTKVLATAKPTQVRASVTSGSGYSFYDMANRARWMSKTGKVVFGSDRVPLTGLVQQFDKTIQPGNKNIKSLLLTQPNQQRNGYIQGQFPYQQLTKDSKFISRITFLPGTPRSTEALFELIIGEGKKKKVIVSRKLQGGRTARITADLSPWTGRKVYFILKVSSIKQGQKSPQAVWIDPKLY